MGVSQLTDNHKNLISQTHHNCTVNRSSTFWNPLIKRREENSSVTHLQQKQCKYTIMTKTMLWVIFKFISIRNGKNVTVGS